MDVNFSHDLIASLCDWHRRCSDFEKSCDNQSAAQSHYQTVETLIAMFRDLNIAIYKFNELEFQHKSMLKKIEKYKTALKEIVDLGTTYEVVSEPDGNLWYERKTPAAEIASIALEK